MVIGFGFQEIIPLLVVISAALAAIMGIVVLERFFRDRLKELFSDTHYFIFFFLVIGYLLYAVGEVSFYITEKIFRETSLMGIADVYWSGGALLILASFIALAVSLYQSQQGGEAKIILMPLMAAGLVLLFLVFFTFRMGESYFFGYFYPIISALIVAFAANVIFYFSYLGTWAVPLRLFFFASCGILIGDLLFTYGTAHQIYATSLLGKVGDIFYLGGYSLSGGAFLSFWKRLRQ